MLKFKLLLWALTKLLQRAIKKDPAAALHARGKNLVFQMQTIDGIGRHFIVNDGKVSSKAGLAAAPQFTMCFSNVAKGFSILSAKDSKGAFLAALHDKDLVVSGDFVEVLWFQRLTEFLQPKP